MSPRTGSSLRRSRKLRRRNLPSPTRIRNAADAFLLEPGRELADHTISQRIRHHHRLIEYPVERRCVLTPVTLQPRRRFLCRECQVLVQHRDQIRLLPVRIRTAQKVRDVDGVAVPPTIRITQRSEEHTSELQSQSNLVCRLLLE